MPSYKSLQIRHRRRREAAVPLRDERALLLGDVQVVDAHFGGLVLEFRHGRRREAAEALRGCLLRLVDLVDAAAHGPVGAVGATSETRRPDTRTLSPKRSLCGFMATPGAVEGAGGGAAFGGTAFAGAASRTAFVPSPPSKSRIPCLRAKARTCMW